MKKLIAFFISLTFIVTFASVPAEAKILHRCHHCGGDGIYTCDAVDCKDGNSLRQVYRDEPVGLKPMTD